MSNLPVDRNKDYMYQMWGTTKLTTDYNALNDELGAAVKQVDAAVNKMRALMNSSVFEMYANMGWPGIDPQMAEFIYTDFNAWVEDCQDAFRDVIW